MITDRIFKALRAVVAIVYTIFHIVFITSLTFLVTGIYSALMNWGDWKGFRNQFTWHTHRDGALLFEHVQYLLEIKAQFDLPEIAPHQSEKSFIVVSNHQSLIDTLILCVVMWRMKLTRARWILKMGVWVVLPIAMAAWVTLCAFVRRTGKQSGDLEVVAKCAAQAQSDDACLLFFPEGGRFVGASPDAKLQFTRVPRLGGWLAALKAMPTADVLAVRISWGGMKPGAPFGRTLWEAAFAFVRNTLDVKVRHVPRAVIDQNPNWLVEYFEGTVEEELRQAALADAA